jgi:hypothetical protein
VEVTRTSKEFQAQLLISEAVRRSLGAVMSGVEDLGPVELKGQPNPARILNSHNGNWNRRIFFANSSAMNIVIMHASHTESHNFKNQQLVESRFRPDTGRDAIDRHID